MKRQPPNHALLQNKSITGCLWLLASFWLSPLVLAETVTGEPDYWYHVEVVTFSRNQASDVRESWHQAPVPAEQERLSTDSPMAARYANELPRDALRLVPEAYSIGRKSGYQVQSHQAWKVGGLPREGAPWLKLVTDSDKLTGKVRIYLSTYLHANIDLQLKNPDAPAYYPPASTANSPAAQMDMSVLPPARIPFVANRRMKLDELHYIDHPMAGVLIKIERFEKASPQA